MLYRLGNDDNRTESMIQLALAAVWYEDKRRPPVRLVGNSSVVFCERICFIITIQYIVLHLVIRVLSHWNVTEAARKRDVKMSDENEWPCAGSERYM